MAVAGGIGAGKTVVARRLEGLGYEVIDADVVARAVVEPGEPAHVALVDAFGAAVLDQTGAIDRRFLADVVFHDASALTRLNAITHPYIGREIARQFDAATSAVVFVALPLFEPSHRAAFGLDAAWAVQAAPDVARTRLVEQRHMSDEDARARLAAQKSNEERATTVDLVFENNGSLEELYRQLDDALAGIEAP